MEKIRVRLEFTAVPMKGRYGFQTDRKITALRVLMRERFGDKGEIAVWDWLTDCANDRKEAMGFHGGNDAA